MDRTTTDDFIEIINAPINDVKNTETRTYTVPGHCYNCGYKCKIAFLFGVNVKVIGCPNCGTRRLNPKIS